jgi:ubiquitin-protein ligase E3 C
MHHAFTGSTRKSRQVDLSGRQNVNPWAALPGSVKSSHGTPTTNATVAQAQAERQRRQHERERQTATRKVQKAWRGHEGRRRQKAVWRQEWDRAEQDRIRSNSTISFADVLTSQSPAPAYPSEDLALSQLRLLVHFQEYRRHIVRDDLDTLRLLYFADALHQTWTRSPYPSPAPQWRHNLSRLGVTTARHIQSATSKGVDSTDQTIPRLASLLTFLSLLIPNAMSKHSILYMQVLRDIIDARAHLHDVVAHTIVDLLSHTSSDDPGFYHAFASEVLGDEGVSHHLSVLQEWSAEIDQEALAETLLEQGKQGRVHGSAGTGLDSYLWKLSYLTWMHRHGPHSGSGPSSLPFIQAVSALLTQCADEISERWEVEDFPMSDEPPKKGVPLTPFVQKNLAYLIQQDTVRQAISDLSSRVPKSNGAVPISEFDSARHLADYTVSLLRAFPHKAPSIRMWLYQGSVTSAAGKNVSAIQYLWSNSSKTSVFRRVAKGHRGVLSVLKHAAPENNQIGRPDTTPHDVEVWKEEWRIILLFLELYTFILKLMDDDDFFSLEKTQAFGYTESAPIYSQFRKGALPLAEIASLTTFLKNLAFSLYWNVVDLKDTNESEDAGNIAALFGDMRSDEHPQASSKVARQTLTGNGVSHTYLKGLATGLLRMIHERDSRRPFLPKNHWLMTSQIDMTAFIPAVVAEEEKRHEIGDEDDEDDLEDGVDDPELVNTRDGFTPPSTLMHSMFNIRQPHIPRSMTSQAGKLERQQNQARKKRLIESLAPRLEILRNLPFFIPFETRVQIFREFVHRDQLRRRDGFVDADQWRMNLHAITQGRDINGRPPSLDRISRQHAEIHRESVFEDAYSSYYPIGDALKEPIQISFIDKFGAPEAGIDGGGVTKEFLMSVTAEALDPNGKLSMFQENEQRYLYPNPALYDEVVEDLRRIGIQKDRENYAYHMREFLRRFEFLGRVIGKCLYEGILIDVSFAGFFLLKWALTGGTTTASSETAYRASINDLRDYDEALYQGLIKLKNYPGDVEADLGLNFTVSETITLLSPTPTDPEHTTTKTITKDLIPKGASTPVTNLNRHLYIDRIVRYRLQQQPQYVTNAFLRGLGQIIQPAWLAMFNQKELQHLVGGDNAELDIADLRRNTLYSGLYMIGDDGLEHPTVALFWKVLQTMSDTDRRKVVKFVTSTPRAPLLGFSHLNPKFSIRDSSEDQTRLPSTSTCVNLLKLPRYGDLETMRRKLLYAVNAGAGFDLS